MPEVRPAVGPNSQPTGRWLSRWMIAVGVVYLALAVNLGSLVVAPDRVHEFYPTYDAPLDSVATAVAIDLALMFALELGVVGVFLLWASRRPNVYVGLVPVVVGLEVIRGILDDVYLITMRTYTIDTVYYGFIALHLAIIVTGIAVYRGVDGSRVRRNRADGRA